MIGCQLTGKRETAFFRHYNVFHKTSFCLTRATQEPEITTGVVSACKALITFITGHRGIYCDLIARFYSFHRVTNFHNNSCSLVSYGKRILYFLRANLALCIIMDIRSTYTKNRHSYFNII